MKDFSAMLKQEQLLIGRWTFLRSWDYFQLFPGFTEDLLKINDKTSNSSGDASNSMIIDKLCKDMIISLQSSMMVARIKNRPWAAP